MDANETPIYHTVIASGIILMLFNAIFIGCAIWMQRRLLQKKRERDEAVIIRMEEERLRIAADLHDATGPLIYSVKRKIEDACAVDIVSKDLLETAQEQLNVLSEQLHSLSKTMVPLSLKHKGLLYCLEELVMEIEMENKLKIYLNCGHFKALNKVAETHIYRIVQEIIQNTLKHSMATELCIVIKKQGTILHIKTSDNGKGFTIKKEGYKTKGLGIGNIETRASFLKGTAVMRNNNGCNWDVRLNVGK